jgi:hypothetical protein
VLTGERITLDGLSFPVAAALCLFPVGLWIGTGAGASVAERQP